MHTTKTRTAASATALDANQAAEQAAFDARLNGATAAEAHVAYQAAYASARGTVATVTLSTQTHRGARKGTVARAGGLLIKGFTMLAVASALFAASAAAAQGQEPTQGAPRWDKPALTVHVADKAAWDGTDVQAALAQWSPAIPLTLTDDTDADITLAGPVAAHSVEGATAHRDGEGSTITTCTVVLSSQYVGADNTTTLAHELGHCLGLSHNNGGESSVMYWIEGGEFSSPTVTVVDLAAVRNLHR